MIGRSVLLAAIAALLWPASAAAGLGIELLATPPAQGGRGSVQFEVADPALLSRLGSNPDPTRFRAVVGHGQSRVTGVRRVDQAGERVFTVLAFDGSGSFADHWAEALTLARTFAAGLPASGRHDVRVATFGLQFEIVGDASNAAQLGTILDGLAGHPPRQRATRLKSFITEAVRAAARELPVSAGGVRQVVVFTDAGEESDAFDAGAIAAEARDLGVRVHVATLYRTGTPGPSARRLDDMKLIAERSGGISLQLQHAAEGAGVAERIARAADRVYWLDLSFCGVSAGDGHLDESLQVEVVDGANRIAWTSPASFRQDAAGAAAACPTCTPACAAGQVCENGACVGGVAPGDAPALPAASTGGGSSPWWLLLVVPAALAAYATVRALRRRPESAPARAAPAPTPVSEPRPVPAPPAPPVPAAAPVPEASRRPAKTFIDPFAEENHFPETRLVALRGPVPLIRINKRMFVLGREEGADAVIPLDQVSGHHATLQVFQNGNVFVIDEGSSNGTFIDDRRLATGERSQLRPGQVLELSKRVAFRLEQPSLQTTPPAADPAAQAEPTGGRAQTVFAPLGDGGTVPAGSPPDPAAKERPRARTVFAPLGKKEGER